MPIYYVKIVFFIQNKNAHTLKEDQCIKSFNKLSLGWEEENTQ